MRTKSFLLFFALWSIVAFNAQAQQGLLGEYYNGKNFDQKVLTRTDPQINFVWNGIAPATGLDPNVFSVRWSGKIQAPESGNYLFRAHVDDGIRVMINGKKVIDHWDLNDSGRFSGEIYLNAGQQYTLQVEYFNALFEGEIQLYWQLPSEAPVFKGLLGYNDKIIEGRYFSSPPPPTAASTFLPNIKPSAPAKPTPAPAKKPAAKPIAAAPKPVKIAKDTLEKYLPKNVFFVQSKSIMLAESEPELDRLAGFLLRNPTYNLTIEGHTDHVGNAAKNLLLSEQRAQTVAAYLTQKGIASQRITSKGYGDTKPLIREVEGVPNAKNRRVEFLIQ